MSNENTPRRPSRRASLAVPALILAVLATPEAKAQSIDYGALESLFGEPVTTSATGTPRRVSEVPVAMEIITAEDIRRSGATTVPDVLGHLAGINVMHISPSQVEVGVRGYIEPLADSHLMVLVNGRQVYANLFGNVVWETLPVQLDEIRQIEVVKGANSALYGFNAVGGVINIITYNPLYDGIDTVRVRGGSDSYGEASAIATVKGDRAGLRLSAGAMAMKDPGPINWQAGDAASRGNTQRNAVSADAMVQATDGTQIRLEANYARDSGRHFFLLTPLDANEDTASAKLGLLSETSLGLVEASLYHNHMVAIGRATAPSIQAEYHEETTVFDVSDMFKLSARNTVRVNGEFRYSETPTYTDSSGQVTANIGSLGGVWDHTLTDTVSILSAARVDAFQLARSGGFLAGVPYTNQQFDRLMIEPSFNEAVSWRASELDTLRASVARGVQLPSLGAYGNMTPLPNGVTFYGDYDLDPSHVMDYQLSYDRALPTLDAATRLTLFHQRIDNLRGYSQPRLTPQFTVVSVVEPLGSSKTYGVEGSVRGKIMPNWQWDANLTFQRIFDSISGDELGKNFSYGVPAIKANAHLGYADGPWEADLWATYSGAVGLPTDEPPGLGTIETVRPSYVLSPRVAYKVNPAVTVEVEANSLWRTRDNPISATPMRIMGSVAMRF